ncbi:YXWGXW repeat-containing protein [Diaphorobacter aerolatus]|uniref:YXWGXW repeat-containing protein n=1 Tax=Diaphorobacter aerolatus TaxID=1288495 RepID=A0A7H0GM36_9BURK|nr:YXWGXW repeat-containing protein [Diaphorobacter aerolatus]QNP49352.1 YXWGXW repeat-containing protein [Diaphorobacter aerolatus]
MIQRSRFGLAAAALSAVTLTGCIVAPVGQPYYNDPYSNIPDTQAYAPIYAPIAPPAPYVETVPVAPYVGAVWIGGYWNWSGGRHAWVPGRYVHGRPGYGWSPRTWSPGPRGGYQMRGGGWHRR